jgi:hypothetical protein
MIHKSISMKESEFQDLIQGWLMRTEHLTKTEIFREFEVGGVVPDFLVFTPYAGGLIRTYEVKMPWDSDRKRLERQIKVYETISNYVYVCVLGKKIKWLPEHINQIVFDVIDGKLKLVEARYPEVKIPLKMRSRIRRIVTMGRMRNKWAKKAEKADEVIAYQRKILEREQARKKLNERKD